MSHLLVKKLPLDNNILNLLIKMFNEKVDMELIFGESQKNSEQFRYTYTLKYPVVLNLKGFQDWKTIS